MNIDDKNKLYIVDYFSWLIQKKLMVIVIYNWNNLLYWKDLKAHSSNDLPSFGIKSSVFCK